MNKPWKCDHCAKTFAEADGAKQHHNKKHPGKRMNKAVRTATKIARQARLDRDDDESFADRAIAASLDHAMGISNPDYDWLVEPYT